MTNEPTYEFDQETTIANVIYWKLLQEDPTLWKMVSKFLDECQSDWNWDWNWNAKSDWENEIIEYMKSNAKYNKIFEDVS